MNIFKNFKTKRQLKEENEKLKDQIKALEFRPPIIRCERRIRKIRITKQMTNEYNDIPEEFVKRDIEQEITRELRYYINYNICNDPFNGKTYFAELLIVADGTNDMEDHKE